MHLCTPFYSNHIQCCMAPSNYYFFHHRKLILIFHPDAHRQCWTSILIIPDQYRQSCRAEKASFKNRRFSYVQFLISSTTGKTEKAQFCPRLWKNLFQGNETKLAKAASHNPVSPVPPSSWLTLRRRTSSLARHLLATEGRPPSITHQRAKLKNFNLCLKGISFLIALKNKIWMEKERKREGNGLPATHLTKR